MGQATGRVIRHELGSAQAGRSPNSYRPVFEFNTAAGQRVELPSPLTYQIGCGKYPIGSVVSISYDESNPTRGLIDGQNAAFELKTLIAVVVGAFALILAGIWILR